MNSKQSIDKSDNSVIIASLIIIVPIILFGVFMMVILPLSNSNIPRPWESSYQNSARMQGYPYQVSEHCFSQYKTILNHGYSCWGDTPREELIQDCMTYSPIFSDNKTAQRSMCEFENP